MIVSGVKIFCCQCEKTIIHKSGIEIFAASAENAIEEAREVGCYIDQEEENYEPEIFCPECAAKRGTE